MQKTFIGILLVILGVVLFALNNSSVVSINFWKWGIDASGPIMKCSNDRCVCALPKVFSQVHLFLLKCLFQRDNSYY